MVILLTLLVCLIIALICWGIYTAIRSVLSNKWIHDSARQDVVHLFNRDLPKWLESAYTALNQHLQTQGSKNDWSIEITHPSNAVIDRCRINFSGSQGIILDSANQQLLYYKTKDLSELHALQCANANPREAFEHFTLPYSDIFKAQLITSKHTYTHVEKKGGITRSIAGAVIGGVPGAIIGASTAKQHTTEHTVYEKLAIVIQSKNLNHPYIELDFSNNTAVCDMWKILQTSKLFGNVFDTITKYDMGSTNSDTYIKIGKRFSALPSLAFPLQAIGPVQSDMLNQALFRLEAVAQADSSPVS